MKEIEIGSKWRGKKRTGYKDLIATVTRVEADSICFEYRTPKGNDFPTVWNRADFEDLWEPAIKGLETLEHSDTGSGR